MKSEYLSSIIGTITIDVCIVLIIWQSIIDGLKFHFVIHEPMDILMIILAICVAILLVRVHARAYLSIKILLSRK